MIVKYRCSECTPEFVPFFVRERRTDEDLMEYMKELQEEAGNAHDLGSFGRCHSGKVDLIIPLSDGENKGIGHK